MPQPTRQRLNTMVAQQAQASVVDLDRFTVRQHPSGDRYVVTARSASAASPAVSGGGATPRSVASTPGRRPPAAYSRHPTRRCAADPRQSSYGREQLDEQYLQYYSTWRHIATSKTEREADALVLSAIQRSPMRRFLEEGDRDGSRSKRLAQALESLDRPQQAVPKPLTLQDKRRKQLERMKQTWKLVDETASRNNNLSLEAFLTEPSVSPAPHGSGNLSAKGCSGNNTWMATSQSSPCQLHSSVSGGQAHLRHVIPGGTGARASQTRSPGPGGWEPGSPPGGKYSREATGTAGRLAEEARTALASLGIQRPPSTARSNGAHAVSHSSSSCRRRSALGASLEQGSIAAHEADASLECAPFSSQAHGVHSCAANSITASCDLEGGENTFTNRQGGGRTTQPPPALVLAEVDSGYETPVRDVRDGDGVQVTAECKASPVDSEDGAWDAELDDLLKWTDNLSPVAEV